MLQSVYISSARCLYTLVSGGGVAVRLRRALQLVLPPVSTIVPWTVFPSPDLAQASLSEHVRPIPFLALPLL